MKHLTTDTGLDTGIVTGVFRCAQVFPTIEVPDATVVDVGWTKNGGGAWVKGAALLAQETADGNDATKRTQLKNAISTFQSGTATNAQVQDALAFLLRKLL